uniref:Uncharacterized protein n=1 Tax=Amphilophus citrinellus TaxID=61819 RepID=A0A3Q0SNI0_AMPCI
MGFFLKSLPKSDFTAAFIQILIALKSKILFFSIAHAQFGFCRDVRKSALTFSHVSVHLGHKSPEIRLHGLWSRISGAVFWFMTGDQTEEHFPQALNLTDQVVYCGGIILFISRCSSLAIFAKDCGEYGQDGLLTNANIQQSLGVCSSSSSPSASSLTLNNVFQQHMSIRDSAKINIPMVGVVDSNCNPSLVTYPVPGTMTLQLPASYKRRQIELIHGLSVPTLLNS